MEEKLRRELLKELASAGGKARAKRLTSEQRIEIARAGGRKRWKGHVKETKAKPQA